MIALSVGATAVAHDIHYAVLGVGLLGLLALLGPQLLGGQGRGARDEHALRVRALAAQIAEGSLGAAVLPAPAPPPGLPVGGPRREVGTGSGAGSGAGSGLGRLVPLAVVSSAAAAGVHAAVGPAHFREQVLFGVFFAGSALAQITWAVLMALRPSRALLVAAVVGNGAVLLLWLTTRTVGLPGLLPSPEAVGPWDLSCGLWELVVVFTAARAVRLDLDPRLPAWAHWEPTARAWTLVSALVLLVLTLSGARA